MFCIPSIKRFTFKQKQFILIELDSDAQPHAGTVFAAETKGVPFRH